MFQKTMKLPDNLKPGSLKPKDLLVPAAVLSGAAALAAAALVARPAGGKVGNPDVPEPVKMVDLNQYLGLWYEWARYENRFEKGQEAVTAHYALLDDGHIEVINRSHKCSVTGPETEAHGKAKIVEGSNNAKLKVSFFGPFYVGDYWVMDHADDYSWSIVGEPSGRFLWILTRVSVPSQETIEDIEGRVLELGYDWDLLRFTQH